MREYPDSLRDTNGLPVRFDCDCAECEPPDSPAMMSRLRAWWDRHRPHWWWV